MANLVTGEVRFSYANVWTPRASQDGGDPKFSVTVLVPKSDVATMQHINAEIQSVSQEAISTTFGGQMPARLATPVYDGDGVRPSGEPFNDECHGHWVFTASSKQAPEIVDNLVQPILNQSAFYSGCYGRVSVRFFAYNKAGKKGIGCGLNNIQKLRDGQPLAGGSTATEDFGAAAQPQYGAPVQPPYQQPVPQYNVPVQPPYQQPVPQYNAPAQPAYQQPQYNAPAQPAYPPQQYGAPVAQPPYQVPPQQMPAIDPATGFPFNGPIAGI